MTNKYPYIVHLIFIRWTAHGGGHRTHHTRRLHKKSSKRHKNPDKPPGKLNPNRNAKLTLHISRGEFGVFCYGYLSSACDHISAFGCRSPPDQSF